MLKLFSLRSYILTYFSKHYCDNLNSFPKSDHSYAQLYMYNCIQMCMYVYTQKPQYNHACNCLGNQLHVQLTMPIQGHQIRITPNIQPVTEDVHVPSRFGVTSVNIVQSFCIIIIIQLQQNSACTLTQLHIQIHTYMCVCIYIHAYNMFCGLLQDSFMAKSHVMYHVN